MIRFTHGRNYNCHSWRCYRGPEFEKGLPNIHDALVVKKSDGAEIILEVHDHINKTAIKCIALGFTQGLKRGTEVISTGGPLRVPICSQCLGRAFNVFGAPIDGLPPLEQYTLVPIHKRPPVLKDQVTTSGILETGIKIIDLLSPFPRGGKIGLFGGAGVGTKRSSCWLKTIPTMRR